jgi:proteic killer suppression protein
VITRVEVSRRAEKELLSVPRHVALKLRAWVADVGERGLEEVRKTPGFHDEPLKGPRVGQRSIRLSLSYRAIYVVKRGNMVFVSVEEVTKHGY